MQKHKGTIESLKERNCGAIHMF